jgi:hypothetical protein
MTASLYIVNSMNRGKLSGVDGRIFTEAIGRMNAVFKGSNDFHYFNTFDYFMSVRDYSFSNAIHSSRFDWDCE